MERKKARLEIYEGDPFGSACCGPGPLVTSVEAAEKFRQMLTERNQTVEKLSREFADVAEIEREILSRKRHDYPDYVSKLIFDDKPLPYVFLNGEPMIIGRFPTYEEFVMLLRQHLETSEASEK